MYIFFKRIFQVVNSKDLRDAKYFFLNLMMSFSIFPRLDCIRQVVFKGESAACSWFTFTC